MIFFFFSSQTFISVASVFILFVVLLGNNLVFDSASSQPALLLCVDLRVKTRIVPYSLSY